MQPTIAVLHLGALGDLVVAIPAIHAWRRGWGPRAHLTLAAAGIERATWLRDSGCAHEAEDLSSPAWAPLFGEGPLPAALAGRVRAWDAALVLLRGGESVARRLEAHGCRRASVVEPRPPEGHVVPVVDWLLEGVVRATTTAREDGSGDEARPSAARTPAPRARSRAWPPSPRVRVPSEDRDVARRALAAHGCPPSRTLIVHPGAGGARKRWPLERFVALARAAPMALGLSPLVVTGPVEGDAAPEIAHAVRRAGLPHVASPPVRTLAALCSAGGHFVGNDAGATHVAAAVGARTLSLFGPSDARVWAPRGRRALAPLVAPEGDLAALPVEAVLAALRGVPRG